DTPARKAAVDAFTSEFDPKKLVALWANVQKAIYADAPFMKIGDFTAVSAESHKLDGVDPAPWPYFWNVSIKK
ncbi:ABC transporter substrate-binding protein, partial [Rhizobium ruizarguesonis]